MLCPIKSTVWGPLNSKESLLYAINKSGQPFGVDWSGPACNVIPTAPCNVTYYQYLGFGLHQGIDLPCPTGTEIYASADGKVQQVSDVVTQGIGLVLWHKELNLKTVYWHLKSHSVNLGDTVKEGDIIAISDNTGYSIGPHLHFEVKLTDSHGNTVKAVDPVPYISFPNDMRFVKVGADGVEIWIVNNSKRSHISNQDAFQVLSGNWSSVEVITQLELDAIPDTGIEVLGWTQK